MPSFCFGMFRILNVGVFVGGTMGEAVLVVKELWPISKSSKSSKSGSSSSDVSLNRSLLLYGQGPM